MPGPVPPVPLAPGAHREQCWSCTRMRVLGWGWTLWWFWSWVWDLSFQSLACMVNSISNYFSFLFLISFGRNIADELCAIQLLPKSPGSFRRSTVTMCRHVTSFHLPTQNLFRWWMVIRFGYVGFEGINIGVISALSFIFPGFSRSDCYKNGGPLMNIYLGFKSF
jgi:hypothetical protein